MPQHFESAFFFDHTASKAAMMTEKEAFLGISVVSEQMIYMLGPA